MKKVAAATAREQRTTRRRKILARRRAEWDRLNEWRADFLAYQAAHNGEMDKRMTRAYEEELLSL
jgi:hypothetical protein